MIGQPTDFRHTAHIGSGDMSNGSTSTVSITRALHAGADAQVQLPLENSKLKKGHNFVKIFLRITLPYWYGFPF